MVIQFYLEFVRDALRTARESLETAYREGTAARTVGRGFYGDTTYELDRAVEEAVLTLAKRRLPKTTVISEERGIEPDPSAKLTLLLDPIDGSTNAKRRVSLCSTSLALADGATFGDIFVAGVMDHMSGRMIWGSRGAVYEDWALARPSRMRDLSDAILAFDSKVYRVPHERVEALVRLMKATKYPRIVSTAALETAYVASGRFEAFVAPYADLRSFDCLPAIFLVLEAGGAVDMPENELNAIPLDGSKKVNYVAAGNRALLKAILGRLNDA